MAEYKKSEELMLSGQEIFDRRLLNDEMFFYIINVVNFSYPFAR